MSPGAMPEVEGGAEGSSRSVGTSGAGPRDAAFVERRRRLLTLAGLTVHGSDGRTVGRVRDIYLEDATGELAAITVMPRQLSARSVLIPAAAIASLPEAPPVEPADDSSASVIPSSEAPVAPAEASVVPSGTEDSGRPAAPAVVPTGRTAPAPTDAAPRSADDHDADHDDDHAVHLLVDTRTAKAGTSPPQTLHVTPQDLHEASAALHLTERSDRG